MPHPRPPDYPTRIVILPAPCEVSGSECSESKDLFASPIRSHQFSTTYELPSFCHTFGIPFSSISYELPNLQVLCFDIHTKCRGVCTPSLRSPDFRMFFQVPYALSPLLPTLTKTAGVYSLSSQFGIRFIYLGAPYRPQAHAQIPLCHTVDGSPVTDHSAATSLESTLAELYQNKRLYPPLESTLTKKPEGGPSGWSCNSQISIVSWRR